MVFQRLHRLLADVDARERAHGRAPAPRDLESLFDFPGVDRQVVGEAALCVLALRGWPAAWTLDAFDDPLVQAVLGRSLICDLAIEEGLARVRSEIVNSVAAGYRLSARDRETVLALARQARRSGYLRPPTGRDVARLRQLADDPRMSAGHRETLAVMAMFGEPWVHSSVNVFSEDPAGMPAAESGTDAAVRRHYGMYPYPPWEGLTVPHREPITASRDPVMARVASQVTRRPLRILVAGCGTGLHPIRLALRYEDVEVDAIDVSRESLRIAAAKAHALGVATVRFRQVDLLELAGAGRRYDIVESIGVLHHLDDPVLGFRALVAVTERHGCLKIGVYNERARRLLRPAQRVFAERTAAGDDTRTARMGLIRTDPAAAKEAARYREFFHAVGIRDLLAHPREHAWSVESLAGFCASAGADVVTPPVPGEDVAPPPMHVFWARPA